MVKKTYIPRRGDIVWIDHNPQKGHEQAGMRPALVLSPLAYNEKTGLAILCPITSISKGYPFEVVLTKQKTKGVVLADHIRTLDWHARDVRYIEPSTKKTYHEVQQKLLLLLQ